jgi:hypothetical protein
MVLLHFDQLVFIAQLSNVFDSSSTIFQAPPIHSTVSLVCDLCLHLRLLASLRFWPTLIIGENAIIQIIYAVN